MEVLIFDLSGKMAHFRKYYTNSSSLTYYFPPRTVIIGLIAGLIGKERDSYYEIFSKDKAYVGISIKSNIKKIIQTVNYIWAEKLSDLNLSKGQHTQIPLEIITPQNFDDSIKYRIYFYHKEKEIYERIIDAVKNKNIVYPPYLGIAEFTANIKFLDIVKPEIKSDKKVIIDTVVNLDYLNDCKLVSKENCVYIKERMPYDFKKGRILNEPPKDFVVEIKNGKIDIESENEIQYYFLDYKSNKENILFM
ncbi:MAG TPA: type I-B CRISPR-associated protein Cas5b [Caldisericia bacterium]|nr:type I-B CRISPR-associated protein Cas5b [Caldisericia bacterium]